MHEHGKAVGNRSSQQCTECGGETFQDVVQMAVWTENGLVVIDEVPAIVCRDCMEQFFEEEASSAVRKLMVSGFPKSKVIRELRVPVFSLELKPTDDPIEGSDATPLDAVNS
jgi:YgiT-type zinc finger domain-containing protein